MEAKEPNKAIELPKQLKNPGFRFCLLKPKEKTPFETDWQHKRNYGYDSPRLIEHLNNNGNIGIIAGYGNLRILDIDNVDYAQEIMNKLPETFTIKTGNNGFHLYLFSDYSTNSVLKNNIGEFRALYMQCVCVGFHPNGNRYEIYKDVEIAQLPKEKVKEFLKPYLREYNYNINSFENQNNKDNTRSGNEFRTLIKLISKGFNKDEIQTFMIGFEKWRTSHLRYRELSYEKALRFVQEHDLNQQGAKMETKRKEHYEENNKPIVETNISLSEDKKWIIHTTRIVDIKPVNYMKKVMGSK